MIRNSLNTDMFNNATGYLASNINLNNLQFSKIETISKEKFTNTLGFGYKDLKLKKAEKKNKENFPLQENAFGYFYNPKSEISPPIKKGNNKIRSEIAPPIKNENKKTKREVPLELRRTRVPKNRESNSYLDFKFKDSREKVINQIEKKRVTSIKKEMEVKRITEVMNIKNILN